MKSKAILFLALICLLAGCASKRSISNSAYPGERRSHWRGPGEFEYRGELSEFDVLGLEHGQIITESEIASALDQSQKPALRRGSAILLIQSGAAFPDGPMVTALDQHVQVVPFSGIPPTAASRFNEAGGFAKSMRLAAARAGAETVVCYWGMLESEEENLATKTISWVPVVNWIVPDERQHMRLRLKVALMDVRTGHWSVISTEPETTRALSTSPRRGVVDQKQVERLKQRAYVAASERLRKQFGTF
jgi:hypothetical protein